MKRKALLVAFAAVMAGAYAGPPPTGGRETLVRTVTTWNSNCSGSARCWDNMLAQWYIEMVNPLFEPLGHGGNAWVADGFYVDGSIVDSDFTDPSIVNWGRDHWNDRIDDVDVAMIGLHGYNANSNNRWLGGVRINEAGTGNCFAAQVHMELGDRDAEFLHISSCVSMDVEDWHPEWSSSFRGIHQINAFNGIMYIFCSGDYPARHRDFADDSFYMPIALAWLDNMYDIRDGIFTDQCPVSRGVGVGGDGQANCWNRMYQERYTNVLSDPTNPTWHGVIYAAPCVPQAGSPLFPN